MIVKNEGRRSDDSLDGKIGISVSQISTALVISSLIGLGVLVLDTNKQQTLMAASVQQIKEDVSELKSNAKSIESDNDKRYDLIVAKTQENSQRIAAIELLIKLKGEQPNGNNESNGGQR